MPVNDWIWIPLVLGAAGAQTVRNVAQRSLVKAAGTLPATFVRFFYGLPFAVLGLIGVAIAGVQLPDPNPVFLVWIFIGAMGQLAGTGFLLKAMELRSFVVGVAFAKTDILQVGILSIVLLGEPLTAATASAIAFATAGVILLSLQPSALRLSGGATLASPVVLLGLASGTGFAFSAVGYRAATLALDASSPWVAGIYSLTWAQAIQTALLGAYLLTRDRPGLMQVIVEWRVSTLAGFMGALASMGWLTAFAMRSAVDVRIVGLVEMIYSYALSRRFFKEPVTARETWGMLLIVAGIVVISLLR